MVGGNSAAAEGEALSASRSLRRLLSAHAKGVATLRQEVIRVDNPFSPFVEQILSNQLSWLEGSAHIAKETAQAAASAQAEQRDALLDDSLSTLDIAREDMRRIMETVQLAMGRSRSAAEADLLALRGVHQAQHIEAVTGWRGWGKREANPGLRARFFRVRALKEARSEPCR